MSFEVDTQDNNNLIKLINIIANQVKPEQVDKILISQEFFAEENIFIHITYFVENADKIKEYTKIVDEVMSIWTKKIMKYIEQYVGVKVVVWNTEIIDSKSDL